MLVVVVRGDVNLLVAVLLSVLFACVCNLFAISFVCLSATVVVVVDFALVGDKGVRVAKVGLVVVDVVDAGLGLGAATDVGDLVATDDLLLVKKMNEFVMIKSAKA